MDAHQIGLQLRAQVLRDRQQGHPPDLRRLQAVIGDLCGEDQPELVVPLRYLVLSGAFASAASMDPPLADGRLLPRLQNELAQMYAAPLCARLQPVLEELLGLPAAPSASAVSAPAPVPPTVPAAPGASSPLNALLAFLCGLLLMALAGMGLLLWQRHNAGPMPLPSVAGGSGGPQAPARPQPDPVAASAPISPALDSRQPPGVEEAAAVDRSVASIQRLYQLLSAKDFHQAQSLIGSAAADQFDADFFRQFERVSVQDLRLTAQVGSTMNLEGVVSFIWPDGSIQTESRTFSVDTASESPMITASEFGRVIKPR